MRQNHRNWMDYPIVWQHIKKGDLVRIREPAWGKYDICGAVGIVLDVAEFSSYCDDEIVVLIAGELYVQRGDTLEVISENGNNDDLYHIIFDNVVDDGYDSEYKNIQGF